MSAAIASLFAVLLLAAHCRPGRAVRGRACATTPSGSSQLVGRHALRVPRRQSKRHRQRRIAALFPDLVDVFVATVRAGFTPSQAVAQIAPVVDDVFAPAVREVLRRLAVGELFAQAVTELPTQLGPSAAGLADSLALADRYGLPLGPVLDRLADEARNQRRRNAEAAARQLPIRMSFPLVCCTLPSFVLLSIVPLLAGTISSMHGFNR